MYKADEKVHEIPIDKIDTSIREKTREKLGDLIGLSQSIKDQGLINPIILNLKSDGDYELVSGLRRFKAVKMLEWNTIPARFYTDLDEYEQQILYLEDELAHKQTLTWQEDVALKKQIHEAYTRLYGARAEEEKKKANLLTVTPKRDKPGRPVPAWTKKKTAEVLDVSQATLTQDIKLAEMLELHPELAKAAISKRDAISKMYRIAERKLAQELARRKVKQDADSGELPIVFERTNCFEFMAKLEDESIDFIVTDPPWGINVMMLGKRQLDYDPFTDNSAGSRDVYTKAIAEFQRIMKDGSHLWIFHTQLDYAFIQRTLVAYGFCAASLNCVWVKEGAPSYTNKYEYQPMPGHENFTFAYKGEHPRRLNHCCSSVFTYKRAENPIHPTEKPVELIKRLVQLSSDKGDVGLDPFAGSGSFLQACLITGRRGLGCEIDEKIYGSAMGRLKVLLVDQKAKKVKVDAE